MDALAGLLDGVRARGAFVLRLSLDPPWSMRIQDDALTLICQTAGNSVVITDSGDEFPLTAGDIALASGACHYLFTCAAGVAPQLVIHPGQRCTTLAGEDMRFALTVGVRTWGNSATGTDRAVIGAYEGHSEVSARLLRSLPPVLVVQAGESAPLTELLITEAGCERTGQEVYLDRLLDLMLIDTLRTWFDGDGVAPPWWRAGEDAIIGAALRLIHHNPRHPWTVANLANAVGTSRAVLARRFTDLVGEPPIAFLTGWRLALAADLLRSSDRTIAAVADQVGYGTPFALSTAFKRAYGMSPAAYRTGQAAGQVAGAAPA